MNKAAWRRMTLHLLNKITIEHLSDSAGQATMKTAPGYGGDETAGTERNTGLVGSIHGSSDGRHG
jgi:hypothetical protein